MQIEHGQSVIARVPIENELQWMLSTVVKYDSDTDEYQVMDLMPDPTSKPMIVSARDVRRYPQYVDSITPGERFLCIWNDGNQWLSVLYPCQALEVFSDATGENQVVKVKFDGVPQVQYVHASWLARID